MAKRTMTLLIAGLIILAVIAAICVLLTLKDNGLAGSGVYFLQRGMRV